MGWEGSTPLLWQEGLRKGCFPGPGSSPGKEETMSWPQRLACRRQETPSDLDQTKSISRQGALTCVSAVGHALQPWAQPVSKLGDVVLSQWAAPADQSIRPLSSELWLLPLPVLSTLAAGNRKGAGQEISRVESLRAKAAFSFFNFAFFPLELNG